MTKMSDTRERESCKEGERERLAQKMERGEMQLG